MPDEVSKVHLFIKFLNEEIDNTEDTGELQGIEDAALEVFFRARTKKRKIEMS